MASQITSSTTVYSTVYSGAYQRKHQSSASLAFVRRIQGGPPNPESASIGRNLGWRNSPHKWPVTRGKCFHLMTSSWLRRHQMEIFSALLDLCAGNLPIIGVFPTQRPVRRSFDVLTDVCLNTRRKTSYRQWRQNAAGDSVITHTDRSRYNTVQYNTIWLYKYMAYFATWTSYGCLILDLQR